MPAMEASPLSGTEPPMTTWPPAVPAAAVAAGAWVAAAGWGAAAAGGAAGAADVGAGAAEVGRGAGVGAKPGPVRHVKRPQCWNNKRDDRCQLDSRPNAAGGASVPRGV